MEHRTCSFSKATKMLVEGVAQCLYSMCSCLTDYIVLVVVYTAPVVAGVNHQVVVTCIRQGQSWPSSVTPTLFAVQTSANGCSSSSRNASATATFVGGNPSIVGPASVGVCANASSLVQSFSVRRALGGVVSLRVQGTGVSCSVPATGVYEQWWG